MAKVHVVAQRDFLESICSSARPIPALAELIWNGFDASANHVRVTIHQNEMDGVDAIQIADDGYGIEHKTIEQFFGNLGDSWKKSAVKQNGRALHGKNGKGRFKSFALGERVEWKTTYKQGEDFYSYSIIGHANTPDDFEVTEPVLCEKEAQVGTVVEIDNLLKQPRSLLSSNAALDLTKVFAAYLTEYPSLKLSFNGARINPQDVQINKRDYLLDDVCLSDGEKIKVEVSVVEWSVATDRIVHLCDANGVALHEMQIGQRVRAPGFNFTVYIKTDVFRELDKSNRLSLDELDPDVEVIVSSAVSQVRAHFRMRISEQQSAVIEEWKKEEIYPYEDKQDISPVEKAERQVFDILAVNVQSYLPSFDDADLKSKKFTFKLLAQAIKQNPESVQMIISEVLELKKSDQDNLASLLKKTSLSSIINKTKTVANRLNFLTGLELLIFDQKNKQELLERDQLHKILENEAWLFSEEFSLAGSELRLEEVLEKYLNLLGDRKDSNGVENAANRVDLMFSKAIQPRAGEFDFLIVELKRPRKKIDSDVISQIKKYAYAVAADERFHGVKIRWTFIAVSNEFDVYALQESRQRDKPIGQIADSAHTNTTVWIKTWSEIINEARTKLNFINKQLAYEADNDSSKEYLQKTHSKFIPERLRSESRLDAEVSFCVSNQLSISVDEGLQ